MFKIKKLVDRQNSACRINDIQYYTKNKKYLAKGFSGAYICLLLLWN